MPFIFARPSDEERILAFLRRNVHHCPYLYIDIEKYGVDKGTIDVWIQEDPKGERIIAVLMRYTDSFQVFSLSSDVVDVDVDQLIKLADDYAILRIQGPRALIEEIQLKTSRLFKSEFGTIYELKRYHAMSNDLARIEEASIDDIPEIVDLVLSTERFGSKYKRASTIAAFETRLETGFGKNWIIRKDGEIVAHLSLAAIGDEYAVASYTAVSMKHRDYPYGIILDSYFINVLIPNLQKTVFAYMAEPRRSRLFAQLGNPAVSEYGILNRNNLVI